MSVFYCAISVIPGPNAEHLGSIQSAKVHCWVRAESADSVKLQVRFRIDKQGWTIVSMDQVPVAVSREMFLERDLGLEQFDRAAQKGWASVAVAVDPTIGPEGVGFREVAWPKDLNLNDYLKVVAANRSAGTCLYFDKSDTCEEIVNSHSIQKQGALSLIADQGEVIAIDRRYTAIRESGRLSACRVGVRKFSTFRGFCGKHDCRLFAPIEREEFGPTPEQVTLYAYRTVCRELLLKTQSVRIFEQQLSGLSGTSATRGLLEAMLVGTRNSASRLREEKEAYDLVLQNRASDKVRYVAFHSDRPPICVFAGCLFPVHDMDGRTIQDPRTAPDRMDVITFSFVPEKLGWTFLFAWHERSHRASEQLVASIACLVREKRSMEDALFRFALCSSENVAFSPAWWERQSECIQQEILEALNEGTDLFSVPSARSLVGGLEGVVDWKFVSVCDSANLRDESGA